jgi:hypothetical protein
MGCIASVLFPAGNSSLLEAMALVDVGVYNAGALIQCG